MNLQGIFILIFYIFFIIFAGQPAASTLSGISFTTTEPEAITTLFPMVTPGFTTVLPPRHTLSPIFTGLADSIPDVHSAASSGWVAV